MDLAKYKNAYETFERGFALNSMQIGQDVRFYKKKHFDVFFVIFGGPCSKNRMKSYRAQNLGSLIIFY